MRIYSRSILFFTVAALAVQLSAFASSNVSPASQPSPGTLDKDSGLIFVDPGTRLYYLGHSTMMTDVNVDNLDAAALAAGPQLPGNKTLPNDSTIECTYKQDDLGGTTNKFKCVINKVTDPSGNVVVTKLKSIKVRYKSIKPYTDVVTTRLTWALGFGHDTETPIASVLCHGCGSDPFTQKAPVSGDQTFTATSIEASMDGTGIADPKARYSHDSGANPAWYWRELNLIDASYGKASRDQVDALRLYAAFLKHGDNKAIQNKLVCMSDLDEKGICNDPFLYVHDFGNTLGSDGAGVHPLNLDKWRSAKMWNDEDSSGNTKSCVAAIRINMGNGDGLTNPHISEEGRAFLAERLSKLVNNPDKIRAIFTAAHIDQYTGNGTYTIDDWVSAFIARANKIINAHCPAASQQPWP